MNRSSNILGHRVIRSHYPAAYRVVDIGAYPRPQLLINTPGDSADQFEPSRERGEDV
jgi:hypothetical protein